MSYIMLNLIKWIRFSQVGHPKHYRRNNIEDKFLPKNFGNMGTFGEFFKPDLVSLVTKICSLNYSESFCKRPRALVYRLQFIGYRLQVKCLALLAPNKNFYCPYRQNFIAIDYLQSLDYFKLILKYDYNAKIVIIKSPKNFLDQKKF